MNVLAKELDELNRACNSGRGYQCVRSIINYLEAGDYQSAQLVYQLDADKLTTASKELLSKLKEIFGCRLHGKQNCQNWICEK